MKTHEEKSSDQLRPRSELGPRGGRAVLSGRLVDSQRWRGGDTEVTCRLCVGVICRHGS